MILNKQAQIVIFKFTSLLLYIHFGHIHITYTVLIHYFVFRVNFYMCPFLPGVYVCNMAHWNFPLRLIKYLLIYLKNISDSYDFAEVSGCAPSPKYNNLGIIYSHVYS